MKIKDTKISFILREAGFVIAFNSYEYDGDDVYLYQNGVLANGKGALVAIYDDREKFDKELRVAKGNDYQSTTPSVYPTLKNDSKDLKW